MRPRSAFPAVLLALLAGCTEHPTAVTPPDPPVPPPPSLTAVGEYEIGITGIGSDDMQAVVRPATVPGGQSSTLTVAPAGLVLEEGSSASFVEGARVAGGQRYVMFTFRVRNGTAAPLNNLTFLLV